MKIRRKHLTIGRLLESTAEPHKGCVYKVTKHHPKEGYWRRTYDEYDLEMVAVAEGIELPRFRNRTNLTLNHLSRYFRLADD